MGEVCAFRQADHEPNEYVEDRVERSGVVADLRRMHRSPGVVVCWQVEAVAWLDCRRWGRDRSTVPWTGRRQRSSRRSTGGRCCRLRAGGVAVGRVGLGLGAGIGRGTAVVGGAVRTVCLAGGVDEYDVENTLVSSSKSVTACLSIVSESGRSW